jgi:hypothetical protein
MKSSSKAAAIFLALIATLFAQSAQTQGPDSTSSGFITGRVIDQSGDPLPDALVTIRPYSGSGPAQNVVTDQNGKFRAAGLPSLVYLATASLPAYTNAPREPDSTQATSYRVGDDINIVLIKGGVITGSVASATGTPLVRIRVRAQMIRDARGQPSRYGAPTYSQMTDDRGIYRIYGLPSGTYVVFTSGGTLYGTSPSFENDAPTYAPSSARASAAEVTIIAGDEITGVDIRHRGERGYSIAGNVSGPLATEPYGSSISLTTTLDGGSQLRESIYLQPGSRGFEFTGVAGGEYHVTAESYLPTGVRAVSEPLRVKVGGKDLSGLVLETKPLAAIKGRVVLESSKADECKGKKKVLFTEVLISAWHNEKAVSKEQPQFIWSIGGPVMPNGDGDVTLRNLAAGQYQIIARQFAKYWYLRSITLPPSPGAPTHPGSSGGPGGRDAEPIWLNLRAGEVRSGLIVTMAEGAASLRGKVTAAEGVAIPARMYVYLVPAERESALDVLRYFAAPVELDQTVAFNNVAPGRYFVVVRAALDDIGPTLTKLRLPDEKETRAGLHRDAEGAKVELELRPCQNVSGYELAFSPGK